MYLPLKDGKKAPMPRYYKERIYNSEQAGWLKGVMERLGNELREKQEKRYGDNLNKLLADMHRQSFINMYKKAKDGTKI